jgi:hypothetical protein
MNSPVGSRPERPLDKNNGLGKIEAAFDAFALVRGDCSKS